jgi:hypothetical protein
VVWVGLLEKPLEEVRRRPRWTLVALRAGRDVSRARAACLPVVAIVVAGCGRSLLKALFAPLIVDFDALQGAVSGDVGWRPLVTTRCHLLLPCVGRRMATS